MQIFHGFIIAQFPPFAQGRGGAAPAARLHKQSFRPPFPKGGRARARSHSRRGSPRWHSRPLGSLLRRRTRPRVFISKVFARLFQKAAGFQRAAPFGRHPQMAELSILQAYLGVWGPLQETGPQGPSPFPLPRRHTASPPGRWRAAPEGALALCFPAAAGGLVTEKLLSFGIFRHPAGGVVGSRPDRRVTFLCKQESNQRSCQGASAGPLDPRRCRSRLAAAPGLQSRA